VIKEQIKAQMLSQLVDSMTTADPVQYNIISVLKFFLSQMDATLLPTRHQNTCTSHGVSSEEPISPFSGPVWSSREQRPLQAHPQDTGGEPEGDNATKMLLVEGEKNELHQAGAGGGRAVRGEAALRRELEAVKRERDAMLGDRARLDAAILQKDEAILAKDEVIRDKDAEIARLQPETMHCASQLQRLEDMLLQCVEDRLPHLRSHASSMDNQGLQLQLLEDRLFLEPLVHLLEDRLSRRLSSALPQSCSSVSTPEADRQRSISGETRTSVTLASGAGQEPLLLNRGRRTRRGDIQGVGSTSRGF